MRSRRRIWPLVIVVLFVAVGTTVQTSSNTVAATKAQDNSRGVAANDLKPASCDGITLTARISGAGVFGGTAAAELIIASTGADVASGAAGDDCVLGGGGDDVIDGGDGVDVCIGGPGTDTFASCETEVQ